MRISETATRAKLIDPLLTAAVWNLKDRTQVDFEIPVDGYDKEPWNGITDYCLFHPSGEVLAVVEAKKTSRHPREGQEQLRIYLDKVAAREGQTFMPFGFMTNGQDIFYWDSETENPRLVAGFFTRDDLKRLLFIRQNGMPLQSASINTSIVERSYQHEAIRRVTEAFANKKRRALLVMATGTGKTRTIMALIDLFLRTHQAQNVLFLADRDALVEQSANRRF
jgi:type I site-specific restriction endonuclease